MFQAEPVKFESSETRKNSPTLDMWKRLVFVLRTRTANTLQTNNKIPKFDKFKRPFFVIRTAKINKLNYKNNIRYLSQRLAKQNSAITQYLNSKD